MGLWYCKECSACFTDEDVAWTCEEEQHTWLDDCPVERFYFRHCPVCGSEDIEECPECEECGGQFHPDDLDENGLCQDCREREAEEEC